MLSSAQTLLQQKPANASVRVARSANGTPHAVSRACRSHQVRRGTTTVLCQAAPDSGAEESSANAPRRAVLAVPPLLAALATTGPAQAVQGSLAGRIPGQSKTPDEEGYYTYTRPEGKSGGHGVGWSEIPRYSFKIPPGWEEIPVSIADLGGTEVDLRYGNKDQGQLQVVVAPVLRFIDVGFNAQVALRDIGPPEKIIKGFAPELYKDPLEDEDIMEQYVEQHDGLDYYYWRIKPFRLVGATAVRNRVFIISIATNNIKWRKHEKDLRVIQKSFRVPKQDEAFWGLPAAPANAKDVLGGPPSA